MEVSKLCFICFGEGSLNSNETLNGVVTATQEANVGVVGVRGLGGKFASRSWQHLSLNDPHHHNDRGEQEVSPSQDDFGFVCGECEAELEEFCEMHAQLQDIQKRINGKLGEISEKMTNAEHENERKEEFEAYQRCLQLQRKRRGQSSVDVSGLRKNFFERVQIRNLVSQPHPVPDGSVSAGSSRRSARNNVIVDASSSSSFVRVPSAHQPSFPDSDGNNGIKTLCLIPSATSAESNVSCKNQDVILSPSLEGLCTAGITETSLLASSNSTAKRPIRKRRNLLQPKKSRSKKKPSNSKCECEICGKMLANPWGLATHRRVHTGERPFNCQYCQRAFSDRSACRRHEKRIHEVIEITKK